MSFADPYLVRTPSKISFCPVSENPLTHYHLVFFITGNPGLISYYNTFLATLSQLLASKSSHLSSDSDIFHVYGQSLAGFDLDDSKPTPSSATSPYGLEDQIEISLQALRDQCITSGPRQGQPYDTIIIIGHSVGSYILLEIIRRLHQSPSKLTGGSKIPIRAGILLFPTVTHIAESSNGVKISALFRIPDFARAASIAGKTLIWPLPKSVLKWLVRVVTRMPDDAAEVTTKFLRSRIGIWQALHMAKDEMETITEDKWDDKIWGVENEFVQPEVDKPKLIFYFGENDRWVANHARDALISARGREGAKYLSSKPIMLIDRGGIDHGFCIRHSEKIAEKVNTWIGDLVESSK